MHANGKRLNEMNRLADMGQFPALVNAGATLNVLLTLALTWYIQPRFPQPWAPVIWIAAVLACNLLPVLLLRLTLNTATPYPRLREMHFLRDQHKFADWVYIAASANMAFWVLTGWAVFSFAHTAGTLYLLLAIAFFVTFSPVLLRPNRAGSQPGEAPPQNPPAGMLL